MPLFHWVDVNWKLAKFRLFFGSFIRLLKSRFLVPFIYTRSCTLSLSLWFRAFLWVCVGCAVVCAFVFRWTTIMIMKLSNNVRRLYRCKLVLLFSALFLIPCVWAAKIGRESERERESVKAKKCNFKLKIYLFAWKQFKVISIQLWHGIFCVRWVWVACRDAWLCLFYSSANKSLAFGYCFAHKGHPTNSKAQYFLVKKIFRNGTTCGCETKAPEICSTFTIFTYIHVCRVVKWTSKEVHIDGFDWQRAREWKRKKKHKPGMEGKRKVYLLFVLLPNESIWLLEKIVQYYFIHSRINLLTISRNGDCKQTNIYIMCA